MERREHAAHVEVAFPQPFRAPRLGSMNAGQRKEKPAVSSGFGDGPNWAALKPSGSTAGPLPDSRECDRCEAAAAGRSGRSCASSIRDKPADLTRHGDWVGAKLDADGNVAVRHRDDNLVEVAVADDDATKPAAVELAALSGERE